MDNPCLYSFIDLLNASNNPITIEQLYNMNQQDKNNIIKKCCDIAGWCWKDVVSNGTVYTSFAPKI
tara:strand:+ start:304 stop:501 length:198 start_codon:yes stop_codon:yes gene_type:complete